MTPLAAELGLPALIAMRILMGMSEGISLPTMHELTAQWVPPDETSRFVGFVTSGQYVGTVCAMLCSPIVAVWWQGVFYGFGALGLVWCLAWWRWGSSTPRQSPRITQAELRYIEARLGRGGGGRQQKKEEGIGGRDDLSSCRCVTVGPCGCMLCAPPRRWVEYVRALPFVAVVVAHFAHNWGWYLLLSWLPKYLADAQGIEIKTVGFWALLPYFAPFLGANAAGNLADYVIHKAQSQPAAAHQRGSPLCCRPSIRNARRLCQGIDFFGSSAALAMLLVLVAPSTMTAVVLLSLALFFSSFGIAGSVAL
jgi:MFS family permease